MKTARAETIEPEEKKEKKKDVTMLSSKIASVFSSHCVIIAGQLPGLDVLKLAEEANSHGGGIAWKEGKALRYVKGITAKDMHSLPKRVKASCVAHFRIATAGGTSKLLTHPFPADSQATLALRGSGTAPLVFHNGHWTGWRELLMQVIFRRNEKIPPGIWSDSRAIAFLLARYGENFPTLLPVSEKIAVLSVKDGIQLYGTGWKDEKGTIYSNKHFNLPTPQITLRGDYLDSYFAENESMFKDGKYYKAKARYEAKVRLTESEEREVKLLDIDSAHGCLMTDAGGGP